MTIKVYPERSIVSEMTYCKGKKKEKKNLTNAGFY